MIEELKNIDQIFWDALQIESLPEREAFLRRSCGDDEELRRTVQKLINAQPRAERFLEEPFRLGETAEMSGITEQPGTVIGFYKLLQQIGEGGMGIVFMAEQSEPIQRTVALKIIKPGMDTRQVIARFEAERQALAMMDHPNIAKVLDAGATDSGRPYFVMELVKGVPITKYCDEKQLSLRERLDLFKGVCQAVQHAHQKGIIHRDIKPTNVLVAEYDNHAVPKVIDFGVAKATAQKLTERTMFTEFGQVIGTVEYMSPEQAKLNQLDIDTRSDIYSLGVMLYELLTGSTPFEQKRLREAAFDEVLRIIREEEPPKPSTKLSTSDTLPSVAANRHTEPARLSKDVHGELDWIVMKALEKDRNHRYETASGFAADIERHLHDEPVHAGPPSAAYRFRKFARRNRTTLAGGALIAMSLVVALSGIASGIGWAMRDRTAREEQLAQERTARQAKVSGQLATILDDVARLEQSEKWSEALSSARRAEPALAAGEAPPGIQERARQTLADLELVQQLDEIRARSGTVWETDVALNLATKADLAYAAAFRDGGIDLDVLPLSEAVHRISARQAIAAAILPALDDWVAARNLGQNASGARRLADVLRIADPDPWRRRVRDILAHKDWPALDKLVTSGDLDRQPAATLCFLAAALQWTVKHHLAIDVLRQAQWKYPADYWINHRLGVHLIFDLQSPLRVQEGIGFMRVAVALRPQSCHSVMNLGNGHAQLGEYDQAITCFRKAIELKPGYGSSYNNLGIALSKKGLYEDAITAFEEAIRLRADLDKRAYPEFSMILSSCPDVRLRNVHRAVELANKAVEIGPNFSNHWTALGIAHYREGQWQKAQAAFDRSLQLETKSMGATLRWADATNWFFLAMSNWQLSQPEKAHQCYDRALQVLAKKPTWQTDFEQLLRFRSEAEELLEITGEKPTTEPPVEVN